MSPSFRYARHLNPTSLSWLSRTGDPLVHHGRRHFSRMVHAMCNVQVLITNGLLLMGEPDGEVQPETLTYEFVPVLSFLSFLLGQPLNYLLKT